MADALDKAHGRGVVHRDLKPRNVMLTKTGVKLLDFGLAKLVGPPDLGEAETVTASLTRTGTLLGTVQYMAPEQLEGKEADARSDIFALGALIYEMTTGKKAFEGKSQASLIAAILERDPPPLATLEPMTPPALDHFVRVCLAKDPADRWQTTHDVVKQLEWIASTPASTASEASATAKNAWRSMPWIAATAFFVLTTTAMLVYFPGIRGLPGAPPMRFAVAMPEGVRLASMLTAAGVGAARRSISPDGRTQHPVFRRR